MEQFYTTVQAAEKLGLSLQRVQQMIKAPCPQCGGKGNFGDPRFNCDRCQGMGHRIPHIQGAATGKGYTALIYAWALELPDVKNSWPGRGHRPADLPAEFVIVPETERGQSHYTVQYQGQYIGSVYRHADETARRAWYWMLAGGEPQGAYRDMAAAAVALWAAYSAEKPEFPAYQDAQGNEHAEF